MQWAGFAVLIAAGWLAVDVILIGLFRLMLPPERPARDLRRLLADAEADEFDAIIRAVCDDDGRAL